MAEPVLKPYRKQILVCTGPRCAPDTSPELYQYLKKRLIEKGLYHEDDKRVARVQCNCFGVCTGGPILAVQPDGIWYHGVTKEKLEEILARHIEQGEPVEKYIFHRAS
ncbi:MAG: (2Fe-2S) ferredoxin domain-containing protein [Candidatus Omnitrophica bacterium]|nr:(2Fe-2S) ferredoxin domain-containing protein [Candidatus Omnitrophota bacterium]